jgi:hypothetical protein
VSLNIHVMRRIHVTNSSASSNLELANLDFEGPTSVYWEQAHSEIPVTIKNVAIACTKTLLHLDNVSTRSLATFMGLERAALVVYEATSRAL